MTLAGALFPYRIFVEGYRFVGENELMTLILPRKPAWVIYVTAIVLACDPGARAQTTATVSGTVTDDSGGLVPNVVLTVVTKATGVTRSQLLSEHTPFVVP